MTLRYETSNWYQTPLYYDIIFEEDTRREGAFIEAMQERYSDGGGRRILEPACGSGRLLAEMARRGYQVTGFDKSGHMLEFARARLEQEGLEAELLVRRLERFRMRRSYDVALCLVSTFKYLLEEQSAHSHLKSVARALKPGGIYVLGFHLSQYGDRTRHRERWVGRRNGTQVICNIQSWPPRRRARLERVRTRLIVEENGGRRGLETHWWFRTYNAGQFRKLLRKVPELELVATYDFAYDQKRSRPFNDDQLDNVLILRRR